MIVFFNDYLTASDTQSEGRISNIQIGRRDEATRMNVQEVVGLSGTRTRTRTKMKGGQ